MFNKCWRRNTRAHIYYTFLANISLGDFFFFCSCVHWARINKAISNLFALLKFFVLCSLFSIMWFYVILVFTTYLFSYFRLSQTPKRERKFTRNFLDDTCHQHFFSLFFYFLIFRNYWHEHTFISRPTKKNHHTIAFHQWIAHKTFVWSTLATIESGLNWWSAIGKRLQFLLGVCRCHTIQQNCQWKQKLIAIEIRRQLVCCFKVKILSVNLLSMTNAWFFVFFSLSLTKNPIYKYWCVFVNHEMNPKNCQRQSAANRLKILFA